MPLAFVALAAAVTAPVVLHGGFTDSSRSLFVGLALMALAVVVGRDERPFEGLVREPAVVCLVGLAGLAFASSAWTVGEAGDAVRMGLAIGGLAVVAATSRWVVRLHGVAAVAGLIAALAGVEAICGLVSAALHHEPWAQRIGGSWRPGGTFEYSPALVLLQVSALPALGWAMVRGRAWVAGAGAGGAVLAGAVIALAESRVGLVLGLVTVVALVLMAQPLLRFPVRQAVVAAGAPVAGGVAAELLLGGFSAPGVSEGEGAGVVALLGLAGLAGVGWSLVRARLPRGHDGGDLSAARAPGAVLRLKPPLVGLIAVIAAAVAAAGLVAFSSGSGGSGVEPVSGLDHGRVDEWGVAAGTALAHPVLGSGAEGYALAAAEHGGGSTLYAHSLPLEAWAELGPLGLALVIGLYASTVALAWRGRRDRRAWLFIPAVLAFLAANLVDWPWHLTGAAAIWALALGALLALPKPAPAQPRGPALE